MVVHKDLGTMVSDQDGMFNLTLVLAMLLLLSTSMVQPVLAKNSSKLSLRTGVEIPTTI